MSPPPLPAWTDGLAGRADHPARGRARPRDRLLRGDDRQRFECRHHGCAVRHPAKGVNTAVAGDTVYIRGGTYNITTPATTGAGINFTKSGTATNPINYFAYQAEIPVFDFTNMTISTSGCTHGFVINASYLHFKGYFKGLEIRYVPMDTSSK